MGIGPEGNTVKIRQRRPRRIGQVAYLRSPRPLDNAPPGRNLRARRDPPCEAGTPMHAPRVDKYAVGVASGCEGSCRGCRAGGIPQRPNGRTARPRRVFPAREGKTGA